MRTRVARIGVLLVVVLATAACGQDDPAPEPVAIAAPASGVGSPIDLDFAVRDSGVAEFDQWPDACSLADPAVLRAIFPQAEEVEQQAEERRFAVGIPPEGEVGVISKASCVSLVGLTQSGLGLDGEAPPITVTTAVLLAGTDRFVRTNHRVPRGEPTEAGDACGLRGRRIDCDLGVLTFSVEVDMQPYASHIGASGSEYRVDGETVRHDGGGEEFDAMVVEHVLTPLARSAVERAAEPGTS